MPVAHTHEVVRVFLASPGDVTAERGETRGVVESLNVLIRPLGVHIDLYGWEAVQPAFGRPQEIINQDLDICDIFVGILWRRWGTETGEFSSGFEEEYERAIQRRRGSGSPEICIFLKHIDETSKADPGRQLEKVLSFRSKLSSERQVLYRAFSEPHDYKEQVKDLLLSHVLRLVGESAERSSSALATNPERADRSPGVTSAIHATPGPRTPALRQLVGSVELTAGFLQQLVGDGKDRGAIEPRIFDMLRLHTFASCYLELAGAGDLYGTHEINGLYKTRHEYLLTDNERKFVLRTMLADSEDVKPGWFWCQGLSPEYLYDLALFDRSVPVRRGAIGLLAKFRQRPNVDQNQWRAIVADLLGDSDGSIRTAAVDLLAAIGTMHDLKLLQDLCPRRSLPIRAP